MKYLYVKSCTLLWNTINSELYRFILKNIFYNNFYGFQIRQFVFGLLNSLHYSCFNNTIKKRGYEYGRSHFVFKYCKLSRMQIKRLASQAQIIGICRARW